MLLCQVGTFYNFLYDKIFFHVEFNKFQILGICIVLTFFFALNADKFFEAKPEVEIEVKTVLKPLKIKKKYATLNKKTYCD